MRLLVALVAAVAAFVLCAGCSRGSALDGACATDRDCQGGAHCLVGTGLCERFTNPIVDDGGIAAADLRTRDARD